MTHDDGTTAMMEQPAPLRAQPQQEEEEGNSPVQCALVPFSFHNPFHDALRDDLRRFPIAGRHLEIQQGWKNDGKGGTSIGFGASVYDAAVVLSLYLDSHRDALYGKRVIELGCGPGLVGVVASHLNAASVVVTDGDPASVALTDANLKRNSADMTRHSAVEYLWGDAENAIVQQAPYDVILGADIIACPYAGAFQALLRAFLQLSDANTQLILSYKKRHGSEDVFFAELETYFHVERVACDELHSDFQGSDIALFLARQRAPGRSTES